jgi:hypothetical protein
MVVKNPTRRINGKKYELFHEPKATRVKHFRDAIKYPYDCGFYLSGRPIKTAYTARNEIATKLDKFGSWVGSGCGNDGMCDTQLGFRSLQDVAKAKKVAGEIADKYKLVLKVTVHKYTQKEAMKLYDLKESDIKRRK